MNKVIVMSEEQVIHLIDLSVNRALAESKSGKLSLDSHRLTFEEAVEYTGINSSTLRGYCSYRKIPYIKVGRKVFFYVNQLDEWMKSHQKKTRDQI